MAFRSRNPKDGVEAYRRTKDEGSGRNGLKQIRPRVEVASLVVLPVAWRHQDLDVAGQRGQAGLGQHHAVEGQRIADTGDARRSRIGSADAERGLEALAIGREM